MNDIPQTAKSRDVLRTEDGNEYDVWVLERNNVYVVVQIDDPTAGEDDGKVLRLRMPQ